MAQQRAALVTNGGTEMKWNAPWDWAPSSLAVVGLVIAYGVAVSVGHQLCVVRPAREHFARRLKEICAQAGEGTPGQVGDLLDDAKAVLDGRKPVAAGWRSLHSAARVLLTDGSDKVLQVRIAHEAAQLQRRKLLPTSANDSRDAMDQLLFDGTKLEQFTGETAKEVLQLLAERNHEADDNEFAEAADAHRKSMWLCYFGGLAAGTAAFIAPPILIAAGALGGILSRMGRMLTARRKVATDYGLRWGSVFLAPVNGALGSIGLLMVGALLGQLLGDQAEFLNTLNTDLGGGTATSAVIGLATLAGLSETVLSRFTASAEKSLLPAATDPNTPAG